MLNNIKFSQDNPSIYGVNCLSKSKDKNTSLQASLISSSLRIDKELMPGIRSIIDLAINELNLNFEIEAYVYNDSTANASCIDYGANSSVIILLSSGIIQLLNELELKFVIGHEIGHFIYNHHSYPNPDYVDNNFSRLNLHELQRAAEISADRVGLICADSLETVFKTILKVSTGLPDKYFRFDFTAYLQQLNDLNLLGGDHNSLDQTHPIHHIRLKSLLLFSMTPEYHKLKKINKSSPLSIDQVDKKIIKDLNSAGGFILDDIRNSAFERAELWSLLFVAFSDNKLSKDEQLIIRRHFDESTANKAIEFARSHGPEGVHNKFEESMKEIRTQPTALVESFKERIAILITSLNDGSTDLNKCFEIIQSRLDL